MQVGPGYTEKEKQIIAHACRGDLYLFTRWMFQYRRGYQWIRGRHHKMICDALMRVVRGENKRLIINIPPRSGKTEFAINFISWALGHFPDSEYIYTSYSSRLAASVSWQARELVISEGFQRIFPDCKVRDDSRAKDEWRTTAGGIVYAVGTGGSITGYGAGKARNGYAGCILIDDAHKADEASSDIIREGVLEWFQTTLESRKNSRDTPIIVIMQRLHERDIAGWLLAGGNGETWEHLCIPAINDDQTSLWPDKWPISDLRRMEEANPYVFSGQYMQSPSPAEGGLFKPGNIGILETMPADVPEWVRGWDLASTTTGDFTAGVKLGRLRDGRIVIADVVRVRVGPDERDRELVNAAARDGYACKQGIPQDPGQAGVTQVKYLLRQLAGYSVKATPESGNKVVRAEPIASQVNVGNVLMLKGPWNDALINEMRMFPNGTFDDQVDGLSRAYSLLIGRNPSEIFIPDVTPVVAVQDQISGMGTCGRCASFDGGICAERFGTRVSAHDVGCDIFLPS